MPIDRSLLARRFSRRAVVEALLQQGPVSRAELAKVTGLSKQTISEVIGEMEGGGWVAQVGVSRGALGRTAVTYEMERRAAYSLGVDLGGTKLSAALADLSGEIVAELSEATDRRGGRHVLQQIRRVAGGLAAGSGAQLDRLKSVVVGTPGVVDPQSGAIALVPNIPGLSEIDVRRELGALFGGLDVLIENDVNLTMLGEAWRGAARGAENAAFVAVGTGVGLGLIVNGKLVRGATGAAGEIAYLPIGGDLVSPRALEVGAFELEVASTGIVEHYRRLGGSADLAREVFQRLEEGDVPARSTVDAVGRTIALAVAALASILDPELVVMGGSIGVRPELIERVRAHLPAVVARPVTVMPSELGSRAGLVGALSSAVNRLHNGLFGVSDLPGELTLPGLALSRAAE